jgi:hypothetical protein
MPVCSKQTRRLSRRSEEAFELGLGAGHGGFELLDQPAAAVVFEGVGELGAHLGEVGVGVVLVGVGAQREPFERGVGDDHGVPVAGGGAGDEVLAARAGGEVPGGDEHPGPEVELEQLAGELFEHVVASFVLIPTRVDDASIDGLAEVADELTMIRERHNLKITVLGVVLTLVGSRHVRVIRKARERVDGLLDGTGVKVYGRAIRESVVPGIEGTRNMGRLAHEYEQVAASAAPWWRRLRADDDDSEPVSKAAGGLTQDYQDLDNGHAVVDPPPKAQQRARPGPTPSRHRSHTATPPMIAPGGSSGTNARSSHNSRPESARPSTQT